MAQKAIVAFNAMSAMAVPNYQSFMLPILRRLSDGAEHAFHQVREAVADDLQLSEDDRNRMLPGGTQTCAHNRCGWAATYLRKAGLAASTRRGHLQITVRGKQVLAEKPPDIDNKFLEQFPEFQEFKQLSRRRSPTAETIDQHAGDETPEEALDDAYQRLRDGLEAELLDKVREATPAFFERLVVELLVSMGYGGTRADAGQALGRSGDEGIDGIIKEDRLGLDAIYLQAKRWSATVGRPEIQKFAGALQGHRARKGVFITTSEFSREAEDYVSRIDSKIVLIDGRKLASFMFEHNVGVTKIGTYELKRIDGDYFEGE